MDSTWHSMYTLTICRIGSLEKIGFFCELLLHQPESLKLHSRTQDAEVYQSYKRSHGLQGMEGLDLAVVLTAAGTLAFLTWCPKLERCADVRLASLCPMHAIMIIAGSLSPRVIALLTFSRWRVGICPPNPWPVNRDAGSWFWDGKSLLWKAVAE